MEQKGTDDWLAAMADEDPEAEAYAEQNERPPEATVPFWAGTVWRAWHGLRFDRQYGAMGGESPISFLALDAYARRYEIRGVEFENFMAFVSAMDEEYLEHVDRKAKEKPETEEEARNRLMAVGVG